MVFIVYLNDRVVAVSDDAEMVERLKEVVERSCQVLSETGTLAGAWWVKVERMDEIG